VPGGTSTGRGRQTTLAEMGGIGRVALANPRGERLAGWLHEPEGGGGRFGVVVAHGMLSSKDSPKHAAICARLANRGAVTLRFDFAGRGESEGDPELLTVSREVADLGAAVAWLRARVGAKVGVVGSSLGGTVAVLAAAGDPALAGLVTASSPAGVPTAPRAAWGGASGPRRDGRVEVAPGVFIRDDFFRDAARHDVHEAAAAVTCPWLVLHGARDEVVPVTSAGAFARANPRARVVLHPDADHRFSAPAWQAWLVEQVGTFLAP